MTVRSTLVEVEFVRRPSKEFAIDLIESGGPASGRSKLGLSGAVPFGGTLGACFGSKENQVSTVELTRRRSQFTCPPAGFAQPQRPGHLLWSLD
jgi:hypothetical protein